MMAMKIITAILRFIIVCLLYMQRGAYSAYGFRYCSVNLYWKLQCGDFRGLPLGTG